LKFLVCIIQSARLSLDVINVFQKWELLQRAFFLNKQRTKYKLRTSATTWMITWNRKCRFKFIAPCGAKSNTVVNYVDIQDSYTQGWSARTWCLA